MKLKELSLFSGIGAFEEGFKKVADIEIVGYSENNDYNGKVASKVYNLFHGTSDNNNLGPVQLVNKYKVSSDIDILTHGSPCQSFSIVNQQDEIKGGEKGSGTKSSLMWETVRIVEEIKPKVIIWENVKAVLNKSNIEVFNEYLNTLRELGYTNFYEILNGVDFGIPQNRERIFVISIRNDIDSSKFKITKFRKRSNHLLHFLDDEIDESTIVPKDQYISWANKKGDFGNRLQVKDPSVSYANTLVTKPGVGAVTNDFIPVDLDLVKREYPHIFKLRGRELASELLRLDIKIRYLSHSERFRLMGFDDSILKQNDYLGISHSQLGSLAGNSIITTIPESIMQDLIDYNILPNIKEER